MPDRDRLNSWKEIARYLARDVRTVVRWERERGLPVHRVAGGRLARVFAHPHELDAWLAGGRSDAGAGDDLAPSDSRPKRWRVAAALGIAAGLALAGLLAAALVRAPAVPRRLALAGDTIVAYDESGATLWAHRLDVAGLAAPFANWHRVTDLDGDGRDEVLAAIEAMSPSLNQHEGRLLRFAADGAPAWVFSADDRPAFRDGAFGPPWPAADLALVRVGGETRIAWAVHHFTWWPGLLITLDAQGERLGTFVNSGWIRAVKPSPDHRRLLVSGISNDNRAYILAVLDAERPTGRSPERAGAPTECVSCPPGDPLRYVVFPRTDVGREQPFPLDGPSVQTFEDGGIEVQTFETSAPNVATVVYRLGPDLSIASARVNDAFWEWHQRLEADGRLRHGPEACPERLSMTVRQWTPAAGWTSMRVLVPSSF